MNSEAYSEWVDLFDEDVSKKWAEERKELQKSSMLLEALQKELKKVHSILNNELIDLRCKLAQKDRLKGELHDTTNCIAKLLENKENHNIVNFEEKSSIKNFVDEYKSPDLFRNADLDVSPIIDLSRSDEEDALTTSPTLNKGRIHSKRHRLINSNNPNSQPKECDDYNNLKKDLFRPIRSANNETVIDCTPDTTKKLLKTNIKTSRSKFCRKSSKKKKNATLTQIFANCKSTVANTNADGNDSDETYCETSEMGITDMLDYINQTGNDSAIAEDEFSKGAFLNDSDVVSPKNSQEHIFCSKKPKILEPEPIVRGLARKQLTGFACEKCKNFYGQMNLSPEELQKKMDECSKHRYKYNPPDETVAGLWDLTFSASQVKEVKE